MKTYTFIIGSADDFDEIEELMDWHDSGVDKSGDDHPRNTSAFEFEAPEGCDPWTVTLIGRGLAFSNGWCMDDTLSFLVTGALDGSAEQELFEAGVKARQTMKRSDQQSVDVWNPNDPSNW